MAEFRYRRNEDEAFRLFRPLAYDDRGFFICDDLTIGFSFVCVPIFGWDNQLISTISFAMKDVFPANSMLSFSLFSSPDIKEKIFQSNFLRSGLKDPILRETQNVALGYLWGGTTHPIELVQQTSVRHYQVLITFKMPVQNIDILENDSNQILQIKRLMEQRLMKTSLNPQLMTDETYINLMNVMLHWSNNAEWKQKRKIEVDDTVPLNQQILQYDTKIIKERNGIKISSPRGKTFCSMLTARRMPKNSSIGMAIKWFGDPFEGNGCVTEPFIITTNIFYPDQSKSKKSLERKRNHYLKITGDRLTKFAPKITVINDQLEKATKDLLTDEKVVKVSLNVIVFGKSEQSADDGKTAMQSKMAECGLTMIEEDSYSLPTFINHLPFGACSESAVISQRYFTMTTKSAMAVIPIFGEWQGTGTPTLSFVSRTGQLMSFDIFDSTTNFGTMIYAESGAGKSFLTNEIIRSYLSTGSTVWTIDAGESYKKTAQSLSGNYIAFNEKRNISLNMFTMIDDKDPNAFSDSVEMLAGAIFAMTFISEKPSDRQAAAVETILTKVWKMHGKQSLIDHVRDECLADSDTRISDIGHQLEPFCTSGRFGKYFEKPHNVEFKGNFNVLELDGLSEMPKLQAVVLFMLMIQIGNEVYREYKKNRNKKRLVIIDEAWQLLGESLAVASFFEKGFRRWRKYNCGGCVVTQGIGDLRNSKAGRAIADNAAISLILKQKSSAIDDAERENLMSLPEIGYKMLKKVSTQPNHYSEIFFSTNRGMGVGRLIVDPMRILMYSTKSEDNDAIESYVKQGFELSDALKKVAFDREMFRYLSDRPSFLDLEGKEFDTRFSISHYMGVTKEMIDNSLNEKDSISDISIEDNELPSNSIKKTPLAFDKYYPLLKKQYKNLSDIEKKLAKKQVEINKINASLQEKEEKLMLTTKLLEKQKQKQKLSLEEKLFNDKHQLLEQRETRDI